MRSTRSGDAQLRQTPLAESASPKNRQQIFAELFREDDVEKRVAAGVEREEEDEEDLRLANGDERQTASGRQAKQRDRKQTHKVSEHQYRHFLGNAFVVTTDGVGCFVLAHLHVHVRVA